MRRLRSVYHSTRQALAGDHIARRNHFGNQWRKLVDPLPIDGIATLDASPDDTKNAGRALTPDYASPEQIRGDAIGTASDALFRCHCRRHRRQSSKRN